MGGLPLGVHETAGPAATEALGAGCAAALGAGDLVLLVGEMGTGKTTFVRGACRALGIDAAITSPTFTLGRLYPVIAPGNFRVAHLDLHRIADYGAEDPGLLEEYLGPDTLTFAEWPEVAEGALGPARLHVTLAHAGADRRRIEIAQPPR
jgi:tRNA threonylcarbamoyladenosine biosynthesis protein TsaE